MIIKVQLDKNTRAAVAADVNDIIDAQMLADQKTVRFDIRGPSAKALWSAWENQGGSLAEQIEE